MLTVSTIKLGIVAVNVKLPEMVLSEVWKLLK